MTTLASAGSPAGYSIASDGVDVFWGAEGPGGLGAIGYVLSNAICGGAPETLDSISDDLGPYVQVAVNATSVYWLLDDDANPPTIGVCAKTGSAGCSTLVTGMMQQDIAGLVVDDANVYFAYEEHGIMKMPVGSTTPTSLAPRGFAVSMAVDATDVYWLGPSIYSFYAGLWKCSINGCGTNATQLSTVQGDSYLAVDSVNVYSADFNGFVYVCSKSGCGSSPAKLADTTNTRGIATDGVNVYWTAYDGTSTGWIMKCAVGGCGMSPTMLVTEQDEPTAIAVDATSVYWTNTSGSVMRADK